MRYVQAAILICLIAITGLLAAIYSNESTRSEDFQEALLSSPAPEPPDLAVDRPAFEGKPESVLPMPIAEAVEEKPKPIRRTERPAAKPASPKPSAAPIEIAQAPPAAAPEPAEVFEPQPLPDSVPVEEEQPVTAERLRPAPPPSEVEAQAEAPPAPERREPREVTVPAGLELVVRLGQSLSTERNQAGDVFSATLDEPLVVDGLIIADRGARVEGRVTEAKRAGRVKGLSFLACELTTLHTDDGQQATITTAAFQQEGRKTQKEDLKKIGIGAGIGALIGVISGGGKGAAIGAGAGAGAGAGTAAATRGEAVVLRPETRLRFRLADSVTLVERL